MSQVRDERDSPTICHLCEDPAVAVFYFSRGCVCAPATVQPLCYHHAHKSRPVTGGTMELVKNLQVEPGAKGWPMLYSAEALKTIKAVGERLEQLLKQNALDLTKQDGRNLVTDDDVWDAFSSIGDIICAIEEGLGDAPSASPLA